MGPSQGGKARVLHPLSTRSINFNPKPLSEHEVTYGNASSKVRTSNRCLAGSRLVEQLARTKDNPLKSSSLHKDLFCLVFPFPPGAKGSPEECSHLFIFFSLAKC